AFVPSIACELSVQILANAVASLSQVQIRQCAAARIATVCSRLHTFMADGCIERVPGSCQRLVEDAG
ncbi:MAG: hypothetical protein OXQ84_20135, partial [bacterium]|nr:hypothetical protein [bacterium]